MNEGAEDDGQIDEEESQDDGDDNTGLADNSHADGPTASLDDQAWKLAKLRDRAGGLPTYLSISRVVAAIGFLSFWAYLFLYQAASGIWASSARRLKKSA